jgi:TetR/AcrR family transcriptional regulator, copper-responsive repressor
MVQKAEARPRGRPREYDPEVALDRAIDAFWDGGFSGTSLDDLSAWTGMNRPSLYAAFGDKQALYLKTLKSYVAGRRAAIEAALDAGRPLPETLRAIYGHMLDRFLAGEHGARGCYMVGTAATEALGNPEVREVLAGSLRDLDYGFRQAFSAAQERGELGSQADPKALAMLASAVVHTLALRARAGQPRAVLRGVIDSAVKLLCSSSGTLLKRRRGR